MYNPGRPTTRVIVTPMPMVESSMTTISTIAAARGIGWNLTGSGWFLGRFLRNGQGQFKKRNSAMALRQYFLDLSGMEIGLELTKSDSKNLKGDEPPELQD